MKAALAVLTALMFSTLMGTSASAAGNGGATLIEDGVMSFTAPRAQARAPLETAGAYTEIYSTFNKDRDNLYNCCRAWVISTTGSITGDQNFIAMPFSPAQDINLRKIHLGLSYVAGANALYVSLRADNGGVPGDMIHRFNGAAADDGGNCCEVVAATTKGIPLTVGTMYWVVVKAKADTAGGWNWNNTGVSGPFAWNPGDGWRAVSGTIGAMRILGE